MQAARRSTAQRRLVFVPPHPIGNPMLVFEAFVSENFNSFNLLVIAVQLPFASAEFKSQIQKSPSLSLCMSRGPPRRWGAVPSLLLFIITIHAHCPSFSVFVTVFKIEHQQLLLSGRQEGKAEQRRYKVEADETKVDCRLLSAKNNCFLGKQLLCGKIPIFGPRKGAEKRQCGMR